jgi:hypothetical protein
MACPYIGMACRCRDKGHTMVCPYVGDDQDAVQMVGHDDGGISMDVWEVRGNLLPALLRDGSRWR